MPGGGDELVAAMSAYQSGDMDACETLYAALAPALTRYLTAQVKDRDRAYDLLQETFLQLHRARASYQPGRPVRPWVFAIARHVVLMSRRTHARRFKQEVAVGDELPDLPVPPEVERIADRQDIERALTAVAPGKREALLLHHLGGLTFEEVGAVLGITAGAAKVRAHRAMAELRRHFGVESPA